MIRKSLLTIVSIAALSPIVATASPERASVNACASAFAASIAVPGAAVPSYKLHYRAASTSITDFYASASTFTLEAHDPKTGSPIARARCSTDSHGVVTEIASLPLDAQPATLAAQF